MRIALAVLAVASIAAAPAASAQRPAPAALAVPQRDAPADTLEGRPARKSPPLAGALGLLYPGAGQLYAGETRRALWTFAVATTGLSLALQAPDRRVATAGGIVYLGGMAFSVVDAVRSAAARNARNAAPADAAAEPRR
jgi:TM2 domain-containing membrane protein YozV